MLIENLTDVVIPEGASIALYRYRDAFTGRAQSFTSITLNDSRYYASGKAESQLLNYLGLSVKGVESIPWQQRDTILTKAFNKREGLPLVMRTIGSTVMAVVTTAYLPIRHTRVWKIVEECIKANITEPIERFKPLNASDVLVTRYVLKSHKGIWVSNSTKGVSSIALGKCTFIWEGNGFIMHPASVNISHMGQMETIEDKLVEATTNLLTDMSDYVNLSDLVNVPYNSSCLDKVDIANKYKQYILSKNIESLDQFIIALIEAAQVAPPKTKLGMERLAFKIIKAEVK